MRERELKFVLGAPRLESFLRAALLRTRIENHAEPEPLAYTRTTYLDTEDLALLRAPATPRRRLRVREYASAPHAERAPRLTGVRFLEAKESSDGHRTKARLRISGTTAAELLAGRGGRALAAVGRLASPDLGAWLSNHVVAARVTTWYRRTSLVAPGLRVTLDHDVAFCLPEVNAGELATPSRIVATWPDPILEIKIVGALPGWLTHEIDGLDEAVGLSKFEAGMRAISVETIRAA